MIHYIDQDSRRLFSDHGEALVNASASVSFAGTALLSVRLCFQRRHRYVLRHPDSDLSPLIRQNLRVPVRIDDDAGHSFRHSAHEPVPAIRLILFTSA